LAQSSPLIIEIVRYASLELNLQTPFSQSFQDYALYLPFQDQPNEAKSELTKSIELLLESYKQIENMMDSQFSQNFQDQDSYLLFQVPPKQNEGSIDLEKSVEP